MEEFLKESVKQIPAIVAIIWLVAYFIRSEREQRTDFLTAMEKQDAMYVQTLDKHMAYLRDRDAQSKEIAQGGHSALNEIARSLESLREEIRKK